MLRLQEDREQRPASHGRMGRLLYWLIPLSLALIVRSDIGSPSVRPSRPHPHLIGSGTERRKPNLLLIVADDHRGGTLGIDGDPRRATPRLDELARQGVRFTKAFCNAPVCTASRQSFITGRLPHATGVTRLTTALPDTAVTLADWLAKAEYDTAGIGKMHFNSKNPHGFQERVDLHEWNEWLAVKPPEGGDQRRPWNPFKDPAAVWLNAACRPEGLPAAAMDSTYFADQAIDYLRHHKADPFFLMVSFYDPHSPFHFPRDWQSRFRRSSFKAPPITEEDRRLQPKVFQSLTEREIRGIQAAYYTSLSFLDFQVGRVLDALDESGLTKDTVVVFLGDNGYMLGEHGRFEKHCFYEPAVRVPLIVRWPEQLPAGKRVDAMVESVDLFPTVLELLGNAPPKNLHGKSFVPLLRGEPGAKGRDVVFSEYLENEEAMVRSERYKLIVGTGRRKRLDGYEVDDPSPGPYLRLFDLQTDPDENLDLSSKAEFRDVIDGLLEKLYQREVATRDGVEPIPRGLSKIEAIHWCLVPRDKIAETKKAK